MSNITCKFIKTVRKLNIFSREFHYPDETKDLEIEHPLEDFRNYNFNEVVEESNLSVRSTTEQLRELENLVVKYREVRSKGVNNESHGTRY